MTDQEKAKELLALREGITPGPWLDGWSYQSVVANFETGHDDDNTLHCYGGNLLAESVKRDANRNAIKAVPDMLDALEAQAKEIERLRGDLAEARAQAGRADAPITPEQIAAMVPEGDLERIVWSAMVWARENPGPDEVPEYTDGGNSFAEIECRVTVRRILSALGMKEGPAPKADDRGNG